MVSSPPLSVLMLVHNGLPYIRHAVRSVLSQTFFDFEFIVVDDGSTDGTADYLREISADPRVRVLSLPRSGVALASVAGFRACRGRYVARLDADDVAQPGRFVAQLDYLQRHTDCVVVGSSVALIDDRGNALGTRHYPCWNNQIRKALRFYNPFANSSTMFRREAAESCGGYRPDVGLCEDYDLWLRLSKVGTMHNLPFPLVQHRLHRKAVKWSSTKRQLLDTLELKAYARKEYGLGRCTGSTLYSLGQRLIAGVPSFLIKQLWRVTHVKSLASSGRRPLKGHPPELFEESSNIPKVLSGLGRPSEN